MNPNYIYELKYFSAMIWIDPNKSVNQQKQMLQQFYGSQLNLYHEIDQAERKIPFYKSQFKKKGEYLKILIICSSKIIQQVYKKFARVQIFFPKVIVFCGGPERAKQIKQRHYYRDYVREAHYDPGSLIDSITKLEEDIIKSKVYNTFNKLWERVIIKEAKKQEQKVEQKKEGNGKQLYSVKQQQAKFMNKVNNLNTCPSQHKPAKKQKKSPKKQDVQKQQKKSVVNNKKGYKKIKLETRQSGNEWCIFWVVAMIKQIRGVKQNYVSILQRCGVKIEEINTEQNLLYKSKQIDKDFIIFAYEDVSIEEIKGNCNNFSLILRVIPNAKPHPDLQGESQYVVSSIEEILNKLINSANGKQIGWVEM